jgi:hypothetical protein
MRMTLEVQNGMVQIRNRAVCTATERTEGEEMRVADDEGDRPDQEAERNEDG